MARVPSQSERASGLGEVAQAAAIVLGFLEAPDVPTITLKALAFILATVGLLTLVVLALTGVGS